MGYSIIGSLIKSSLCRCKYCGAKPVWAFEEGYCATCECGESSYVEGTEWIKKELEEENRQLEQEYLSLKNEELRIRN